MDRPKRFYMPQLDVMRFGAFLSVFTLHTIPTVFPQAHSGIAYWVAILARDAEIACANGVGLFFLLSAYLITRLLVAEQDRTSTIHMKAFYVRRSLRIWPLYYLGVALALLMQPLDPSFHIPGLRVLPPLFFYWNWDIALHGFIWNPMFALWTVSCEEQFYLIWPFVMKHVSRQTMIRLCYLFTVAIIALSYWPSGFFAQHGISHFLAVFAYFPMGALLAFHLSDPVALVSRAKLFAMGVAGLMLWELGTWINSPDGVTIPAIRQQCAGEVIVMLGTTVLFLAFFWSAGHAWSTRLTYLGKISYGLYVFHMPAAHIITWLLSHCGLKLEYGHLHSLVNFMLTFGLKWPLALLLTILFAGVSYRYFETPFLRLKDRFTFVESGGN